MARLCQNDELNFHHQEVLERRAQSAGRGCAGRAVSDRRYYDKTKRPHTKKAKKAEEIRLLAAHVAAG